MGHYQSKATICLENYFEYSLLVRNSVPPLSRNGYISEPISPLDAAIYSQPASRPPVRSKYNCILYLCANIKVLIGIIFHVADLSILTNRIIGCCALIYQPKPTNHHHHPQTMPTKLEPLLKSLSPSQATITCSRPECIIECMQL